MGNVRSVAKAFEYLGASAIVSRDSEVIKNATHIVLPGVGAYGDGMKNLREFALIEPLTTAVLVEKKPFLGICLGMQLIARESDEFGKHAGLGWLDAEVKQFALPGSSLKVPQVGWNDLQFTQTVSPLFKNIAAGTDFYFVHSYHMVCANPAEVVATAEYGLQFVAAVQKENIFATQFHPEKSQKVGLTILENFIALGSPWNV